MTNPGAQAKGTSGDGLPQPSVPQRPLAHKILLIEDDAPIQECVKIMLEKNGYQVTACGTVAQARAAFQAGRYDLVIVDICLPDGNGLNLVREFGLAAGGSPFIFMTALGDLKTRLEGFRLGAQDYITKPFSVEELLARVRAHLRTKQSRDELSRRCYELEGQAAARRGRSLGRPPVAQAADAARGHSALRPLERTWIMAGFLLLLVLALGAVNPLAIERGISLNEAAERQNAAWETVAGVFRATYLTHDPMPLVDTIAMIKRTYPEVRWLCVVDSGGRILTGHAVKLLGRERRSVKLPKGLHLLVRPVFAGGVNLGRIEIGFEDASSSHNSFWPAAWLIVLGLGFALLYRLSSALGSSRPFGGQRRESEQAK